jgi:hypothetical protein
MGGSPSVPTLLDDLPFNRLGDALLGWSRINLDSKYPNASNKPSIKYWS